MITSTTSNALDKSSVNSPELLINSPTTTTTFDDHLTTNNNLNELSVTNSDEHSIISLTSQYEDVKGIRERYGIGIELNEQTKSVTESLKGMLCFNIIFTFYRVNVFYHLTLTISSW